MREHILLFVNGQQHRLTGADAFLTLSNFLRLRLGLCGTKTFAPKVIVDPARF